MLFRIITATLALVLWWTGCSVAAPLDSGSGAAVTIAADSAGGMGDGSALSAADAAGVDAPQDTLESPDLLTPPSRPSAPVPCVARPRAQASMHLLRDPWLDAPQRPPQAPQPQRA